MRKKAIGISTLGLVASLVVLVASCGPTPTGETTNVPVVPVVKPSAEPPATSSAAPSAPRVDLRNPAELSVSAWTDDDVVRALAADCHWDPGGCLQAIAAIAGNSVDMIDFAPEDTSQPTGDTRRLPATACKNVVALACAAVPGQSCVPDECSQNDYNCVPACDSACAGCADKCVSGCETCKSGCKDDACRLACAKTCAGCRQGCLKALDQCASAGCSEEMETCFKARNDEWKKSTCPKVCPKVQSCVEKCPDIENDFSGEKYRTACALGCLKKLGKGCPARFDRICMGDPNASVNFNAYNASHE